MSMTADIAKIQGVSRNAITADPTLRGDAATSPTEVTYFHITMWDTTGATGSAEVDIVLEQVAVFMEPRDFTESLKSSLLLAHLEPVESKSCAARSARVSCPRPQPR
jgi:hypothetical protein